MAKMINVYINGRFLSRRVTGVERFAMEVIRAIDLELSSNRYDGFKFILVLPRGIGAPTWLKNIVCVKFGFFSGFFWEQFELPLRVKSGFMINLCNTAPVLKKNQVCVIHDVATFDVPFSYSLMFRSLYRFLIPLLYRRCRYVATVSNFSKQRMISLFGDRADFNVLNEGVEHILRTSPDFSILDRFGLVNRRFCFAVASAARHKNFELILRAASMLEGSGIVFVIAGGGDDKVFKGSDLYSVGDNVVRVGYVSDNELKALYLSAECFLFPSLYEGYGLPPTEALACMCPIVVSEIPSLIESSNGLGRYFPPTDCVAFSKIIANVFDTGRGCFYLAGDQESYVRNNTWAASANKLLSFVLKDFS